MFLPVKYRNPEKYGSLYIEFAFNGGQKPNEETVINLIDKTAEELKEYGFIKKVIVADPTWIEVAYTWQRPKSNWVEKSLQVLAEKNIISIGRYGKWSFNQGVVESLKEGIFVASVLKAKSALEVRNNLNKVL